jgi:ABC-2 type transport system permease protein
VRALLGVEFSRILARRVTRLFAALAILGAVLAGTVLFVRSHRVDASVSQATQVSNAREKEIAACARGEYGIDEGQIPSGMTLAEFCREFAVGVPEAPDPAFHLSHLRTVFTGTNVILMLLLMALAASFVGAEWHAGTMTTLLTWEPRRLRVLGAKLIATATFAFVALLAVQALIALALLPSAIFHGTTSDANDSWLRALVWFELRAAVIAAFASTLSFSIASIGRNSAVAVGGLLGYMAVLEPIVRSARPKWQPWFIYDNVATFLTGHPVDFAINGRSMMAAGAVIAAYTALTVAVAMAVFKRRDVG